MLIFLSFESQSARECLLFLVIYRRYLHVDNGGNCTPLSLHSWMMRAFTFLQMSNTLKQDKKEYFKELQKEMSKTQSRLLHLCI